MPTDPLTGSRFPDSTYAATIWTWIEQAVRDLSDNTIPYFTTTTARNTAYTNWIAAGGVWRKGLFCVVDDVLYKSGTTSGTWSVVPTSYETRMMTARREVDTTGFPNNSWASFSDTNWVETDSWGMRSSGGMLVAVWTGWYQINGQIWWDGASATGTRGVGLQPSAGANLGEGNGNLVRLGLIPAASGGFDTVVNGSTCVFMTAGDTADLVGFQTSGGTLTTKQVQISAAYLGPNT